MGGAKKKDKPGHKTAAAEVMVGKVDKVVAVVAVVEVAAVEVFIEVEIVFVAAGVVLEEVLREEEAVEEEVGVALEEVCETGIVVKVSVTKVRTVELVAFDVVVDLEVVG